LVTPSKNIAPSAQACGRRGKESPMVIHLATPVNYLQKSFSIFRVMKSFNQVNQSKIIPAYKPLGFKLEVLERSWKKKTVQG
jgi:hypothetical protein